MLKKKNKKNSHDGKEWTRGHHLGKGAYGSVYFATADPGCRRFPPQMAVKCAQHSDSSSLQNEREVLKALHGCPYVIRYFGHEITKGTSGEHVFNLLLEYAAGGSLHSRIRGSTMLPESEVRQYTKSILKGIEHVHAKGYVHRDIKPANILLVSSNRNGCYVAKLSDFGSAMKASKIKVNPSLWGSTVTYVSPEAAVTKIQGPACDIWALGWVVLEMLTGKTPWEDKGCCHDADVFIFRIGHEFGTPEIPSCISEEGKQFLRKCLARKVVDRLTATQLLNLPFISGRTENRPYQEDQRTKITQPGPSRPNNNAVGRHNNDNDRTIVFGPGAYLYRRNER